MSDRPCPICSSSTSKPWKQKGLLTIVTCNTCGMKFVRDTTIIPADYYEHEGDSFYVSNEKLKGDHNPERYRREVNFFTKHCPTGSVLDVGCSTGGFLLSLAKERPSQYQLYGTDVAPEARNIARSHGLNILEGEFTAATLPNAPFDAITFWAVLEHLTNPQKQITAAHQMLKPGGLLFAVVPNVQSLATHLLGARYRYILPEHLNYFSTKTLSLLLKNNFEPIEINTSHFNPIVIIQDAFRRTDPTRTQRAQLLTRTNRLKQKSSRPIKAAYQLTEAVLDRFRLADNIMAVFRKTQRAATFKARQPLVENAALCLIPFMKRFKGFIVVVGVLGILAACTTAPVTGRKQLSLVSGEQEAQLGLTEFEKMKKETPISREPAANALLQKVGKRIAASASKDLPNAQWEFVVFENKEPNAFCLPGGKIGVHTGILPITKDEAGLATVIGHEVAHASAHHGAERMSQAMAAQGIGQVAQIGLSAADPSWQAAFQMAYPVGAQLGLLRYSRQQESEADRIGLHYMARAGYRPEAAVQFWERFSAAMGKSSTPNFLRTHPIDTLRIADLKKHLPEAQQIYNQSTAKQ